MIRNLLFCWIILLFSVSLKSQHSVAREWNEVQLQAIREDFARPPVQARNLFHVSVAMYDAWAAYDSVASTYFLGKNVHGFTCPYSGTTQPADIEKAREEAISYAAYRMLSHRYKNSPGVVKSQARFDSLMNHYGYDPMNITLDYTSSPAGLGNYLATFLINYGFQDGSNESGNHTNLYYKPVNPVLLPMLPGNPDIIDPNRWQPLTLDVYIDQNGHVLPNTTPAFQSPEWGRVKGFALSDTDLVIKSRDSNDYWVYHMLPDPPYLDTINTGGVSEEYKWSFELVSKWSSHLDPNDTVMWDISPASKGNNLSLPASLADYHTFYDEINGGDPGKGYALNPKTNLPYQKQFVKRADYCRVLAEFWADGPKSETPPGHWFSILNTVNDHPLHIKKFKGSGAVLDDLEWDVKSYFALGGALHDAAITAWGIKGYFDYVRPISALRYMADLGQSSDTSLPSYHPGGVRLDPGKIELVSASDPLAGPGGINVGKIKIFAWKGPDYIADPKTDVAGVDWILAENWWPYQRPTFVTPPFAGYISGHSTYSRAAAELLTAFNGDPYFPGGLCNFFAKKDEFLVFEDGPSANVTLQWATYRDASDQCSLSRIWGGIHPPADDIPGRIVGMEVAKDAFERAEWYFGKYLTGNDERNIEFGVNLYPNPVDNGFLNLDISGKRSNLIIRLISVDGKVQSEEVVQMNGNEQHVVIPVSKFSPGMYVIQVTGTGIQEIRRFIIR